MANSEGNSLGEKLEGLLGGRRRKTGKNSKNARKSRKTRRNGVKKQLRRGGSAPSPGSAITAGLNKKH